MSTDTFDLLVRGGTLVTPSGIAEGDVGIRAGKIAAIGALSNARAASVIEARGLHVLPGLIDTQVHFREPGLNHKEDLATGTAAAAMGGITAVFEMPNTKPTTATAEALQEKLDLARGRTHTDHAFFVGATGANAVDLEKLERLPGTPGVKIFMGASTGDLLVDDDARIADTLAHGFRRVAVHAEDEARLKERRHIAESGGGAVLHPQWRDAESARLATERLLKIARGCGRRIHVLHVTTAEEVPLLAAAKDIATMEVTPQHLLLHGPEAYERLGTYAQMNPPIREKAHQDALWRAIVDGVVDVIGSDHAPHTRDEKAKPYPQSPSGMPGVQTTVPLLLNAVNQGRLTLTRLVDLLAHGPQRIYGIAGKGRLALGYDGDLTIVDLKRTERITASWLKSKCGWSPFEGDTVQGWPVATIIRGHVAMRDAELGPAIGAPVRFSETLPRA